MFVLSIPYTLHELFRLYVFGCSYHDLLRSLLESYWNFVFILNFIHLLFWTFYIDVFCCSSITFSLGTQLELCLYSELNSLFIQNFLNWCFSLQLSRPISPGGVTKVRVTTLSPKPAVGVGIRVNKRGGDSRKCRKVYGMERRHEWCTQCKWKKACTRYTE